MNWNECAPFFESLEFDCKCGCGLNNMHQDHMDKLIAARVRAKIPFIINSGSRCKEHNRAVGGSVTSDHCFGHGSDIQARSGRAKWIILESLMAVGFNRIGIGKDFIHAGSEPKNPERVVWTY